VKDTVAEMGWWACFREDRAENTVRAVPNSKLNPAVYSQIRRATPNSFLDRTNIEFPPTGFHESPSASLSAQAA